MYEEDSIDISTLNSLLPDNEDTTFVYKDFNSLICEYCKNDLDNKLVLDDEFLYACNSLFNDIELSLISAIWTEDKDTLDTQQKLTWVVNNFTGKICESLSWIIENKEIKKVYCTFNIDIEDLKGDNIDLSNVPTYLICGILGVLTKDIELIADNDIMSLCKTISEMID